MPWRLRFSRSVILICAAAFGQTPPPALPFRQQGACPYEHCRYGDPWTVHRAATLYDTWKPGRRAVGQLRPGERVTGITGVVITSEPGVIRMDRDLPEKGLRRGDRILAYGGASEGFSAVWFNGRFDPEFDISFAKWPDGTGCGGSHCAATSLDLGKKDWWIEVKLASGQTGWVGSDLTRPPVAIY